MTRVLIKRGNLEKDMHTGKTLHEDEGRDQSGSSRSQSMLKISSKPPEVVREASYSLPYSPQKKPTLQGVGLLASRIMRQKFLLFKPPSL